MAINYGYNKVRFITPVKVGAKIRARAEIAKVDQLDNAVQATVTTTVEIEGSEKPAAVAESIVRLMGWDFYCRERACLHTTRRRNS